MVILKNTPCSGQSRVIKGTTISVEFEKGVGGLPSDNLRNPVRESFGGASEEMKFSRCLNRGVDKAMLEARLVFEYSFISS